LTDKAAKDITSLLDSERELWFDAFIMELTQPITDEEILVAALRILAALAYDGTVGCFLNANINLTARLQKGHKLRCWS
jgi:hypothetical protein